MGKINAFVLGALLLSSSSLFAQQTAVQGFATFTPGRLFETGERTYSLHGELECVLNERVSVIGDGFYQLQNSHTANASYAYNHNLMAGLAYHPFTQKGEFLFDTYVGLEPGIAVSKLNTPSSITTTKSTIDPIAALLLGARLQLTKHLYVFGQFRMIHGNQLGNEFHRLDEIRLSTGLGFTFWNKP